MGRLKYLWPSLHEYRHGNPVRSTQIGSPVRTHRHRSKLLTAHTAAPDLITDGVEGFIVEPRRADLLAERLSWCLDHRADLAAMRVRARAKAMQFTWARFRANAAAAVNHYLQHDL